MKTYPVPHGTLTGSAVILCLTLIAGMSDADIRKGFFDLSRDHILKNADGPLAALKTGFRDNLFLHRPGAPVGPEEVAAAFDTLHAAGKVRH